MGSFSSGKVEESDGRGAEGGGKREREREQSPIVELYFSFGRISLSFRNYKRPENVTK
jgi:hypothetical protein